MRFRVRNLSARSREILEVDSKLMVYAPTVNLLNLSNSSWVSFPWFNLSSSSWIMISLCLSPLVLDHRRLQVHLLPKLPLLWSKQNS